MEQILPGVAGRMEGRICEFAILLLLERSFQTCVQIVSIDFSSEVTESWKRYFQALFSRKTWNPKTNQICMVVSIG